MNEQLTQNYLNEIKKAYNRTLELKKLYANRFNIYTKALQGQKEKRTLVSKINSKTFNLICKKAKRSYLTKISDINNFLDQSEKAYKNLSFMPNMFDAKKACEQSVTLLNKFAEMLEDLYDYTCSVYNIESSITNINQELTK